MRAIAATSVIYFHIGASPNFGSFGVDLFFVMSGFVMALVVDHGQSARVFAIHRLARIVPLYWVLTTCLLIVAAVKPELLNSTSTHIGNYFKSLFFIPYFKENGALHPLLAVGWTLNYEMFFYVCVCLSLWVARKHCFIMTTLLLTGAFVALGHVSDHPVLSAFFGNPLVFEFLFGVLAYKLHKHGFLAETNKTVLVLFAGLSCLSMVCFEVLGADIHRVVAYGIPAVVLVLTMTALENFFVIQKTRFSNVLVSVGNASYATYLSHLYVVEGMRKIAHQKLDLIDPYTPLGVCAILLLSLAVGHVIYIALDKPLSGYFKRRFLRCSLR